MQTPKIRDITREEIIKDIKAKAPFFAPEWKPSDETDPGLALAGIFTEMYLSIIDRLNLVPLRHYLGFLETIDTKLLAPQPAVTPVVFAPAEGTSEDIMVPVSTKVAGKDSEGEPVVFETEKTFMLTPSRLAAVFAFIPDTDNIINQSGLIDGVAPMNIFMEDNLQNHILYIGDTDVLNIKTGRIRLTISGRGLGILADNDSVSWEYIPDDETKKIKWKQFQQVRIKEVAVNASTVELEKGSLPVKEAGIHNIKSRWIRCRLTGAKESARSLEIESIMISVEPLKQVKPPRTRIPVTSVHGVGKVFSEKLYKENIRFVDELTSLAPAKISKLLDCPVHRAENILEAAGKAFYDKTGIVPGEPEKITEGIPPDFIFVNDVPVQPDEFYPFGKKPRLYDTCYIGSEEVFSKKAYKVTLRFLLTPGSPSSAENTPQLSWEYWDGEGWRGLGIKENLTSNTTKEIVIDNLPGIKKTSINGKKSCWIRLRLVGGDYGKEYKIIDNRVEKGRFWPPCIKHLKLGYSPAGGGQVPEHILTENNLQIKRPEGIFRPFEFLSDKYPALYFCFTEPLKKGPNSFYIDVDRYYTYPDNEPLPTIKWQYSGKDGNWKNLNVLDETRGLTRAGTIMFSLEAETSPLTLFGVDNGYWIRGVIADAPWSLRELSAYGNVPLMIKKLYLSGFTPPLYLSISGILANIRKQNKGHTPLVENKKTTPDVEEVPHCEEEIPLVIKNLAGKDVRKIPPVINGVYLNTIIAVQTETIEDETLGSSSGQAGETFQIARAPVINETLWINELNSLSEAERNELKKKPDMVKEEYNEDGQLTGFWVRWKAVENFIDSTPADRHYIIDGVSGEVVFGDGVHGAIPPAGADNIRLTYRTGGGKRGNLPAGEIKELQSAIPFIDSVCNPVASAGGCSTEDIEMLIKRGSSHLRHRNRAVSVQDYYDLAFEASRSVARVKVIPGLDERLERRRGHITIVVVPYSDEAMPLATPILKKQIRDYMEKRASNLAKVHVVDPVYTKINVNAELTTKWIDMIPAVSSEAAKKIREFLHPFRGGEEGAGWEFGMVPCLSDLYALIQETEGVEYVNTISLVLITEDGRTYRVYGDKYLLPEYSLIYPGDIDIKINLGG